MGQGEADGHHEKSTDTRLNARGQADADVAEIIEARLRKDRGAGRHTLLEIQLQGRVTGSDGVNARGRRSGRNSIA